MLTEYLQAPKKKNINKIEKREKKKKKRKKKRKKERKKERKSSIIFIFRLGRNKLTYFVLL